MKLEVKEKLVQKLRDNGDVQMNAFSQYPVIVKLRKVLSEMHPDIDFDSLVGKTKKVDTEKGVKIIGSRGDSWDNILEYSGLTRIDFYPPNYKYTANVEGNDIEITPTWSKGYDHPTPGSIIQKRKKHKLGTTYSEMAEIIESYLR